MARLHVGMTCTTSLVLHGVFIIVNRDDDHSRRGKKKISYPSAEKTVTTIHNSCMGALIGVRKLA